MHGRGIYTFANGTVKVGFYEEDRPKGPGVGLEKASGLFWLLKNGKKVQQISQEEARSSIFGRFVLLSGPGGGEGARPPGAPLVTALMAACPANSLHVNVHFAAFCGSPRQI